MRVRQTLLLLTFLLTLSAWMPETARAGIRVVVNEVPITTYDIGQRARLITLTQRKSSAVAKRMAEEELVDDQVKLGEATRAGIEISDEQVNSAYGSIARNVKMSTSQLSTALRRGGVNPDTLKARLKAQLAWNQLVQRKFSGNVEVDESDIIAALQKTDEEDRKSSIEYDLKRIIVVVPKNSSGGFKSKRKSESNQIRSAFDGCDNAGLLLGKYSEVVVQTIGRRLETELPEDLRKEINALTPGKLTKPSTTPVGYEMIAVCGKREIASDIAVRTELENELRAKEGESQTRRYLMELRRRATIIYR